jgi:ELWxxDGT repeat protein
MANHEVELFRSDGTSQGTALVKNLGGSPAPREIVAFEIDALGANDGSGFAFNNQANESVEHVSNTVRTDSVLAIPTGRRTRLDQLPSPTSRVFGIDRDRLSSTRSDLRDGDETSDVTLDVVFSAWN